VVRQPERPALALGAPPLRERVALAYRGQHLEMSLVLAGHGRVFNR
jgi:hypothetical protein